MKRKTKVILPGSTIGVLGGGQLGRMMALQGRAMGYRFVTLDPTEDAPCGQVADKQIVAAYDDLTAATELAQHADVITYEFENVDAVVAAMLEREASVPQGSELLQVTQHRLREKQAIEQAGVKVAPYYAIHNETQLREAVSELGFPCVVKTVRGGYDGKGQYVVRQEQDIAKAFDTLSSGLMLQEDGPHLVCEQFIPFTKELSVIAARNTSGEIAIFPIAENVHHHNILHETIVPARVPEEITTKAEAIARQIADALQVVGIIAVELFLTSSGELFVNELAPRPHNSGHYTMDACNVSQFEQHIRAICGLPMTPPKLLSPVVMVNILGEHVEGILTLIQNSENLPADITIKTHLYGKKDSKPGRKMGHLNLLTSDPEMVLAWIEQTGIWEVASD